MATLEEAFAVRDILIEDSLEGGPRALIHGIGVGRDGADGYVVIVDAAASAVLPTKVHGVFVRVKITSPPRALDADD
jgi:hypothetical protein